MSPMHSQLSPHSSSCKQSPLLAFSAYIDLRPPPCSPAVNINISLLLAVSDLFVFAVMCVLLLICDFVTRVLNWCKRILNM